MPYRNFNDIPFITQIAVLLTGIWGALMNFVKRTEINKNMSLRKKVMYFFIDLISSGGIAIIIFLGAIGYGFNELLAVFFSGIFAHQGTRAIYLIELFIAEKLNSKKLEEEIKKDEY